MKYLLFFLILQQTEGQTTESTTKKRSTIGWIAICCGGAIVLVFFAAILAAFYFPIIGNVSSSKSTILTVPEIKSQAQSIPYASLISSAYSYENSIIYLKGRIMQIDVYGDSYLLRIATRNNMPEFPRGIKTGTNYVLVQPTNDYTRYNDDVVYVNYKGNQLLTNNIIEIWGNVVGLRSYKEIPWDKSIDIPEINALHVEIVEAKT